ncbi:MAG TPA: HAMP domain-containing sensor histidine kinase [Candidatus Limnocylindrales bacterium]|nr:HAMP domain-containing sensor histidine kinase [Candidatus Limnocylindrales bacterium]
MPDGAAIRDGEVGDSADQEALSSDARLIRRVRWQLVAWSGLSTLLVLLVLGAALYLIAARTLDASGNEQLAARAADYREHPDPGRPGLGFSFGGGGSGTFALLADANGDAVGRGSFFMPDAFPIEEGIDGARVAPTGVDVRTTQVRNVPIRVRTERARSLDGQLLFIQVIQDRTAEQEFLDAILRVLLVGGAVVVLVALGFGAVYARRALVPIRESLAAQRLALQRQREFAADASHELRTPLTVVRSSLDFIRRHPTESVASVEPALDDVDAEVARLTSLVEDLLLLARSDSGAVPIARQPLDLGDVAAAAASSMAKPADAKAVRVVVDPEPVMVEGDPVRLRQLVMILVDNAIRHSPSGGEVRVAVRRNGDAAYLDVQDQGRGVRPEDMPHVFDRFWRASGAPSGGTGLGLAIAKWIVDRHRGLITVSNRAEGGAQFRVTLPSLEGAPA